MPVLNVQGSKKLEGSQSSFVVHLDESYLDQRTLKTGKAGRKCQFLMFVGLNCLKKFFVYFLYKFLFSQSPFTSSQEEPSS